MTTDLPEDLTDLARWAVQQPWWRWEEGMLAVRGACAWRLGDTWRAASFAAQWAPDRMPWPAIDDPATMGVLLAQVREVYGEPTMSLRHGPGGWALYADGHRETLHAPTEPHALLTALAAAHGGPHD